MSGATLERSSHFRDLVEAVGEARTMLLPATFEPTGVYEQQDKIHLHTVSFRLLAHAEIETYLEARASRIMELSWRHWRSDGRVSRPLIAMIAFCDAETLSPPAKLGGDPENQRKYEDVGVPLGRAYGAIRHAISSNNGVKEANVLRMYLPLGLGVDDLDRTLLDALNNFGEDRGSYAHGSAVRVDTLLDPKTEVDRVNALIGMLSRFDELLDGIEARDHLRAHDSAEERAGEGIEPTEVPEEE